MSITLNKIMEQVGAVARSYVQVQYDFENNLNAIAHTEEVDKLRAMIEDVIEVPDGWQLVPIEPTDDMLDAACISQAGHINTTFKEWADNHSQSVKHESKNDR
jgi:hypothetical protein